MVSIVGGVIGAGGGEIEGVLSETFRWAPHTLFYHTSNFTSEPYLEVIQGIPSLAMRSPLHHHSRKSPTHELYLFEYAFRDQQIIPAPTTCWYPCEKYRINND